MNEILQGLPDPMKLDHTTVIIGVLFLVLIAVLNNLVFKPLTAILDERANKIREGKEAHEQSLKVVEESEAAYQSKLRDARSKAQAQSQAILKESEMGRDEVLASAREQAMARVQAAATKLDKQVSGAKGSLKSESEVIAEQIVSAVLSRASA